MSDKLVPGVMQLMDGVRTIWDVGTGHREGVSSVDTAWLPDGSADQSDDDCRGADVRGANGSRADDPVIEELPALTVSSSG